MPTTGRGVASWGDIFMGTDAILDRHFHRGVVFNINDDSYRIHKRPPTGEDN